MAALLVLACTAAFLLNSPSATGQSSVIGQSGAPVSSSPSQSLAPTTAPTLQFGASTRAAAQPDQDDRKADLSLAVDRSLLAPGAPFTLALIQTMQPGWHTYWKHPGDTGQAVLLDWRTPDGFVIGDFAWPAPKRIMFGPLANYGFENEAVILASVTAPPAPKSARNTDPSRAAAGSAARAVPFAVDATLLVCKKVCIPQDTQAGFWLSPTWDSTGAFIGWQVSDDAAGSAAQTVQPDRIKAARRAVPSPAPFDVTAKVVPGPAGGDALGIELIIEAALRPDRVSEVAFFPDQPDQISHPAPQRLTWQRPQGQRERDPANGAGDTSTIAEPNLLVVQAATGKGWPARLSGLITITEQIGDQDVRNAFTFDVPVAGGDANGTAKPTPQATLAAQERALGASSQQESGAGSLGLLQAALFALLGGIILNAMPCVFPVLSLKAMAIVRHAARNDAAGLKAARTGAYAYGAGVLVSFTVLALVFISARGAGELAGWGAQFQS
ncbi:MAG: protein-disulfide reductase DsbD domain-containing protein, partial [Pseudomonadota bacterium]